MTIAELDEAFGASGPADDRLPPQDLFAEQSVLGAMMLSKDAIADVVETIRSADFYRPNHETIFDAILDLYAKGEPSDSITVSDELTKRGDLQRIGGQAYLHQLIQAVPTAANAGYYAEIVKERAVLRRLVEAGTRIVQMGYAQGEGEPDDVINRAQALIYDVTQRRGGEDYHPLGELLEPTLNEIEVASGRSDEMIGVPTGFIELDELTHGLHPGQMIVVAARPAVGKSTLGIDIARSASIKHGLATAVFSLEMSRTEITMRILSAEAQIQLQDLRKGTLGDVGWQKLARLSGEISEAPLFIDDSPNMSLTEIRAKCRRLKQLHNLRLVVIDYLQLMSSGKKVESRQQEVSEFSRALKLLAKELEVPVIAISQLNRGPEQRTDKRPQMSDLRESGCVPGDTRILRADTGAETTIGELAASGERDITVWSLDDGLRYTKRTMTNAFSTGTAPVLRLTLASGKTVRATENHPFLTASGWRPLGSLRTGEKVAVPRHVPSPLHVTGWSDAEVFAAAVDFPSQDTEHRVAEEVFALPKEQIAAYLRHVWEFAGAVDFDDPGGRIYAWHESRVALEGIARLLLRFGIETAHAVHPCGGDHILDIVGIDSMRRFLQEIGAPDKCEQDGEWLLEWVREAAAANAVDSALRGELESTLVEHGETGFGGRLALLERVEAALDRGELDLAATNDVVWERIDSISLDGVEEVYDATVLDCHNFIADGIAVHNSIEQDADVVILLHRDRSEPEREGEADVIVAKHRNGPTKDIVLAFQGHYSRFANMAKDF